MEKPKTLMKAKVPMSETGMVTAGMMVARQSCRKRKMTTMTMPMASAMVISTSRMESDTTVVVSTAMMPWRPGGKDFWSSASLRRQRRSTSRALAFESCWMPTPIASWPEKRRLVL